jgi:hypothetical protein
MCTFIVVIRIFEVMISSPHPPWLVRLWPSLRQRIAGTVWPHCPHQSRFVILYASDIWRVAGTGQPPCPHDHTVVWRPAHTSSIALSIVRMLKDRGTCTLHKVVLASNDQQTIIYYAVRITYSYSVSYSIGLQKSLVGISSIALYNSNITSKMFSSSCKGTYPKPRYPFLNLSGT